MKKMCAIIYKHKLIILAIVIIYLLYTTTIEGMATTCASRASCSTCLNGGYDSTGSTCYWCPNQGCSNPDNFYDSTCYSDKSKCSNAQPAPTQSAPTMTYPSHPNISKNHHKRQIRRKL